MSADNVAWITLDNADAAWDLALTGKTVRTSCIDVNILIEAFGRGEQRCQFGQTTYLCPECGHHVACTTEACSIACATMDDEYTPCPPSETIEGLDVCAVGPGYNNNPATSVQVKDDHEFLQYLKRLEHDIDHSFVERHRHCMEEEDPCSWCSDTLE